MLRLLSLAVGAAPLVAVLAGCATTAGDPPVRDGSRPTSPAVESARQRPDAATPIERPSEPRTRAARAPARSEPKMEEARPGRGGVESRPREPRREPAPHSAVSALLAAAHAAEGALRYGRAVASLERAIKIEPRNPELWHRLARIRFRQGQYAEAEGLALRSNRLATADPALRAENWTLIADARARLGNRRGADEARRRSLRP